MTAQNIRLREIHASGSVFSFMPDKVKRISYAIIGVWASLSAILTFIVLTQSGEAGVFVGFLIRAAITWWCWRRFVDLKSLAPTNGADSIKEGT